VRQLVESDRFFGIPSLERRPGSEPGSATVKFTMAGAPAPTGRKAVYLALIWPLNELKCQRIRHFLHSPPGPRAAPDGRVHLASAAAKQSCRRARPPDHRRPASTANSCNPRAPTICESFRRGVWAARGGSWAWKPEDTVTAYCTKQRDIVAHQLLATEPRPFVLRDDVAQNLPAPPIKPAGARGREDGEMGTRNSVWRARWENAKWRLASEMGK